MPRRFRFLVSLGVLTAAAVVPRAVKGDEKNAAAAVRATPENVLGGKGLKLSGQVYVLEAEAVVETQALELRQAQTQWQPMATRMKELEVFEQQKQTDLIALQQREGQIQEFLSAATGALPQEKSPPDNHSGGNEPKPGETEAERQDRLKKEKEQEEALRAAEKARRQASPSQLQAELVDTRSRIDVVRRQIAATWAEYNNLRSGAMRIKADLDRREAVLALAVEALWRRYAELENDNEVKAALAELNKNAIKFVLGPRESIRRNFTRAWAEALKAKGVARDSGGKLKPIKELPAVKTLEHNLGKIEDRLRESLAKKQNDEKDHAWNNGLIARAGEEIRLLVSRLDQAVKPSEKTKLTSAIRILRDRIAKLEREGAARENVRKDRAREVAHIGGEYVQTTADLRKAVNEAEQKDEQLARDPQIKGMKVEKVPPAILSHLQAAEAAIKSEEIAIEADKIVSWIPAILDGQTRKMVIDPDVDVLRMSKEFAAAIGVNPADSDRTVEVAVDGGPKLKATRTTLKRVQVGSFTVEGVECLVILEGYKGPPLLGADFLEHFAFRYDPEAGKLTLSSVALKKPETLRPARELLR